MTDREYIREMTSALREWAARNADNLSDQEDHIQQWRQRFREFGHGLGDMLVRGETTEKTIRNATGSAYSAMYVVNAFGRRLGIILSASDVVAEINAGITQALNRYATLK